MPELHYCCQSMSDHQGHFAPHVPAPDTRLVQDGGAVNKWHARPCSDQEEEGGHGDTVIGALGLWVRKKRGEADTATRRITRSRAQSQMV